MVLNLAMERAVVVLRKVGVVVGANALAVAMSAARKAIEVFILTGLFRNKCKV